MIFTNYLRLIFYEEETPVTVDLCIQFYTFWKRFQVIIPFSDFDFAFRNFWLYLRSCYDSQCQHTMLFDINFFNGIFFYNKRRFDKNSAKQVKSLAEIYATFTSTTLQTRTRDEDWE